MSQARLASSAIVERSGRFLLVRRGNPPAANLFAFPGGRAEPGETPAETALRELQEETGVIGRNPQLFETVELLPEPGVAGSHYLLSVFRVEADDTCVAKAARSRPAGSCPPKSSNSPCRRVCATAWCGWSPFATCRKPDPWR